MGARGQAGLSGGIAGGLAGAQTGNPYAAAGGAAAGGLLGFLSGGRATLSRRAQRAAEKRAAQMANARGLNAGAAAQFQLAGSDIGRDAMIQAGQAGGGLGLQGIASLVPGAIAAFSKEKPDPLREKTLEIYEKLAKSLDGSAATSAQQIESDRSEAISAAQAPFNAQRAAQVTSMLQLLSGESTGEGAAGAIAAGQSPFNIGLLLALSKIGGGR